MSWQLGAFAILAAALAAGFGWYERRRPDARIVALVGTLSAFAALGRIAFAAVPNVKPTTDIVLISGYALGGGPGFAVGALAALSSNFFFGQGPWTPWQMAGWGATGILGAALAAVVARARRTPGEPGPLGRVPLAVVCCVVGFGFTALQDLGDWVTYSDHSWAQLGAYVGQGLGFDAVHAVGCVAFALAIGPALIRSIQRFARRLQVQWLEVTPAAGARIAPPPARGSRLGPPLAVALATAGLAAAALGAAPPAARAASASPQRVIGAGVSYLLSAENRDGGFGPAPGQPSNELYTGWAALGLAAAGHNLNTVAHGGGLMSYIRAQAGTADLGALERTILVVRAAGLSARAFGGRDLVAELRRRLRPDGSLGAQVNLTSFGVLALRAAGAAVAARTLHWLVRQQDRDGGFSYSGRGGASDIDDTGAALEALAGDRAAAAVRARAVAFLRAAQNRDGGLPSQPGMASNAQSTAWAVQGLDAAGVAPAALRRHGAPSPLAYLAALAAPGGAIAYARGMRQTPVWVTGEALAALAGKPLPLAPPPAGKPLPPAGKPLRAPPARGGSRARRSGSRRTRGRPAHRRVLPAAGRPAQHGSVRGAVSSGPPLAGLETALGAVTALALAPIGLG